METVFGSSPGLEEALGAPPAVVGAAVAVLAGTALDGGALDGAARSAKEAVALGAPTLAELPLA